MEIFEIAMKKARNLANILYTSVQVLGAFFHWPADS
jgi:hypothetical protein